MIGAISVLAVISIIQPETWRQWADVNVTWANIPRTPYDNDWVGVFLVDWPATYVAYRDVGADGTTSLSFSLLNGRGAYVARYYRNDSILAESNQIVPEGAAPVHPRITPIPGRPNFMMVSWTSNRTSLLRVVTYNNMTAFADSRTYTQQDLVDCLGYLSVNEQLDPWPKQSVHSLRCGSDCNNDTTAAQLFYSPGWLHNATIGPLAPSTAYTYSFGEVGGLMSENFTFVSAPAVGSREDMTILYTADVGGGPHNESEMGSATHNSMNEDTGRLNLNAINDSPATANDRLWVFNGDLVYANGWMWKWERWMDLITPLASRMPMAVTLGNHELDYKANTRGAPYTDDDDSGGECGITTTSRFHVSNFYSFDFGSVHFLMFNSELNMTEQRDMAIEDMHFLDRTLTPWTIALLHRPLYGSYNLDLDCKHYFESVFGHIFSEIGVDVVFSGHKHYYERMHPVKNVTYIIDGMGGRNDFDSDDTVPYENSAFLEFGSVGYVRISVTEGATTLTIERFHTDGKKADRVVLSKTVAPTAEQL